MKVLLIEDDAANEEVIRLCFEIHQPDAMVIPATKGLEGIKLLSHEAPDVVILDLGLPDMDGIEVLREIRRCSDVPVIIVSARSEQESLVEGMELGADDYIAKPFEYEDLLARLGNVLR